MRPIGRAEAKDKSGIVLPSNFGKEHCRRGCESKKNTPQTGGGWGGAPFVGVFNSCIHALPKRKCDTLKGQTKPRPRKKKYRSETNDAGVESWLAVEVKSPAL